MNLYYQEDVDCPEFFQLHVDVSVVCGKEGTYQLGNAFKKRGDINLY
jgi:hypothetical protein